MNTQPSNSIRPPPPQTVPLVEAYLAHLSARACSDGTIRNARLYLNNLNAWMAKVGVTDLRRVRRSRLEHYQQHLFAYRKADGRPLAVAGQHVRLTTIRGFFRWMVREHLIRTNPAAELELPRVGHRLPKAVLTAPEVETILAGASPSTPTGLRDRAILELFYSTGMRRQELCNLEIADIDMVRATVLIRQGKGRKDRIIPMGLRAKQWLELYLATGRPSLLTGSATPGVFLCSAGDKAISHGAVGNLVHGYVRRSGVGKSGSCHLFRHAMATLMLERGADIRHLQQMLGHARLSTTEIYTQVNITQLALVHARTHPAEQSLAFSPTAGCSLESYCCPHCGRPWRSKW